MFIDCKKYIFNNTYYDTHIWPVARAGGPKNQFRITDPTSAKVFAKEDTEHMRQGGCSLQCMFRSCCFITRVCYLGSCERAPTEAALND